MVPNIQLSFCSAIHLLFIESLSGDDVSHLPCCAIHLIRSWPVVLFQFVQPSLIHTGLYIGNPGSLCVTRDITQLNYREHMRRSLGLKICWKMEIKIVGTYHVASFCCL